MHAAAAVAAATVVALYVALDDTQPNRVYAGIFKQV